MQYASSIFFGPHFKKMPLVKKCDFVKIVSKIDRTDFEFYDWHITSDQVKNRTGDWYFGVACIGE